MIVLTKTYEFIWGYKPSRFIGIIPFYEEWLILVDWPERC